MLGDEEPPGNPDIENSGPELSNVGSRLTSREILQSIVHPEAVIADSSHASLEGGSKMPGFGDLIPPVDLRHLVLFLGEQKAVEAAVADLVVTVTDDNFREEVEAAAEQLVLLDFWAEWCIPCLELDPILEKIAPDFANKVKICKVEVDSNPNVVADYAPDNIFPYLVLMRQGKVIDQKTGTDPDMAPEAFMRAWLGKALKESEKASSNR